MPYCSDVLDEQLVMASFSFLTGPRTGERISLDKDTVTFGRSLSCDCVLTHPTVSREHFRVERTYGKLFLVDRGSENGTFANSERVSWVELKDGDRIQAGPFTLIFKATDSQTDSAGPADDVPPEVEAPPDRPSFEKSTLRMYAPEYLAGIEHFNAGRYFDAHEVWEEVWLRSSGETKLFYQMLIQAAVGLHHYERGNARGARGMHENVVEKLNMLPPLFMSLDLRSFSQQFNAYLADMIEHNNEAAPAADKPRPRIELLRRDAEDWSA